MKGGIPDNPSLSDGVRTGLRFTLAIASAAALCLLIWHFLPRALTGHTDIVGYPTFADFDVNLYFDAFYIAAIAFPLFAVLGYHIIGLRSARRRSSHLAPVFPLTVADATMPNASLTDFSLSSLFWTTDLSPSLARASSVFWGVARAVLPAVVIAIEVSVMQSPHQLQTTGSAVVVAIAYVVLVMIISGAFTWLQRGGGIAGRHRRYQRDTFPTFMSRVNAILGLSVVPLLFGVSASTAVNVGSSSHVVRYPWLPLWLVVIVTVALCWWTIRDLRRSNDRLGARDSEARTLVIVVGSIALFLCTATFPGALGNFQAFDDAQYLAAPQLIFGHGLVPWLQMVPFHGFLYDVFGGVLGMEVFAHSRWGATAGIELLLNPAVSISYYLFGAYFLRRHRILIVVLLFAIVLGDFGSMDYRWLLYPLLFVGLHQILQKRSLPWSVVFTVAVVLQALIVPETDLIDAGLLLTVVIFELCTHRKGAAFRQSFARTRWCLVTGLISVGSFGAYLLGTRSLGAFIDYFRAVVPGHALEGGLPVGRSGLHLVGVGGGPPIRYTVEFLLPLGLFLLTAWFITAKVRRRSPWTPTHWVMGAAAFAVLVYYEEAFGRAEYGHVHEMFLASVPLIILWIAETTDVLESGLGKFRCRSQSTSQRVRRSRPAMEIATLATYLAGLVAVAVAVILIVVVSAPTLWDTLKNSPGHFHSSAPAPPPAQLTRLGYVIPGSVDTTQIEDLRTVLDTYATPGQPVFDFANQPGIVYYLLNRVPGTRFDIVSDALTASTQQLLISDLKKSTPRLVIFNSSLFGLPAWDEYENTPIWNMVRNYDVSQYLLDHYRPLANVEGELVLLRDDLFGKVPPLPHLRIAPVTSGLYYAMTCAWGYTPNFLNPPSPAHGQPSLHLPVAKAPSVADTVSGWAVDTTAITPASTVVAVRHGRVTAEIRPTVPRPDVAAALHSSTILNSGFSLPVPPGKGALEIFAMNSDGTATPITGGGITTPSPLPSSIRLFDGTTVQVVAGRDLGHIDGVSAVNDNTVWTVHVPPGTNLSQFHWLTVTTGGSPGRHPFSLSNAVGDPAHEITWWSLPQSGHRISVQVGSCLQWHGFGDSPLNLTVGGGSSIRTVTLTS